jgi:hypothetical protein
MTTERLLVDSPGEALVHAFADPIAGSGTSCGTTAMTSLTSSTLLLFCSHKNPRSQRVRFSPIVCRVSLVLRT